MGICIKFIKILLLLYLLRIRGFARLAPISLISIIFFFESAGFYFQYIGLFFLVGLLVTIFFFFLFKILVQIFLGLFFFFA